MQFFCIFLTQLKFFFFLNTRQNPLKHHHQSTEFNCEFRGSWKLKIKEQQSKKLIKYCECAFVFKMLPMWQKNCCVVIWFITLCWPLSSSLYLFLYIFSVSCQQQPPPPPPPQPHSITNVTRNHFDELIMMII